MKRISILFFISLLIFLPITSVNGQKSQQLPYISMWIGIDEVSILPTSGPAWNELLSAADRDPGTPQLSNQDSNNDVYILAKALVYSKTGETKYRDAVLANLKRVPQTENGGRTLALGRNLLSYVIAADLINLPEVDPVFDVTFRSWLKSTLNKNLDGRTLISTHEDRPNNWGTHAGASRIAVDLYLGDRVDLDKAAKVFQGWLGDRSAYSSFSFGPLDWQCNQDRPVAVNPTNCIINGVNIGGSLPEELRRSGGFSNPPSYTDYAWEAMQGAVVQALLLERAGYSALHWSDSAILRATQYLYSLGWTAVGDDQFQPWLLNYAYAIGLPTNTSGHGKNIGWTDWTHGGRHISPTTTVTSTPTVIPTSTPTVTRTLTYTPTATSTLTSTPVQQPTIICIEVILESGNPTRVQLCK